MNTSHQEFWGLAEKHWLTPALLGQITSAPIKVLRDWLDNENTPESALNDLKKYLNYDSAN
jgi:hypothetical protein